MYEVTFWGRGGQGAVVAASVMVLALLYEDKYGQSFPLFGFERRGAPVRAFLRISDDPIIFRQSIIKADCIVVLDQRLPSIIDVGLSLKPEGIAVMNTRISPDRVSEIGLSVKPSKMGVVDATKITETIFGQMEIPHTNMAMLGAFSAATNWISIDSIGKAIRKKFDGDTAERNEKAARMAFEATEVKEANK